MDVSIEVVVQALANIATEEEAEAALWASQRNPLQASIHQNGAQLLRKIADRLSVIGGL